MDKHDGSAAAQSILLWPDFSYFGLIRPVLIDFLPNYVTRQGRCLEEVLVDDGNRGNFFFLKSRDFLFLFRRNQCLRVRREN